MNQMGMKHNISINFCLLTTIPIFLYYTYVFEQLALISGSISTCSYFLKRIFTTQCVSEHLSSI